MTTPNPDALMRDLQNANPVRIASDPADHPRAAEILAAVTGFKARTGGRAEARARRRVRRRPLVLALAGAVLASGVAYGAVRWSEDDVPAAGEGPNAFVLPSTEILPDGRPSTRAPAYSELPVRPSIVFPAGLTYEEAIRLYLDARQRGEVLPPGTALADPLPEGKVVMADGGRVRLDPAAPVGYDLESGLVSGFISGAPSASLPAPALPRCQVLLGADDETSPTCPTPPASVARVQEVDGTWQAVAPIGIGVAPAAGTTALSVLESPPSAVPADWRDPVIFPQFAHAGADLDQARLALKRDGVRYFVIPAADQQVCFVASGATGTSATCNPLGTLATAGRIPLVSREEGGSSMYAALIGDGWQRAKLSDGRTVAIRDNVLAVSGVARGTSITLVGPNEERVIRAG